MLKEIIEKLEVSDQPVIKVIYKSESTKIIAIGLKKGAVLAEHTAPSKTQLIVLKGEIDFNTATESGRYECFETYNIPLDVKHSVVAVQDAMFLLLLS